MENDAVIFDIDGTLWDATPASAKGWNNGLAKLGIDRKITARQIAQVAGHPFDECINILFGHLAGQYPELGGILEVNEAEAVKDQGGVFYKGVAEGIEKLAASSRIFIVSNCQEWYLRILLERSGFEQLIAGYDCNGMSNLPKNAMLARMKDKYLLKNPVYVGDTAGDQEAARLAGIEFIHAGYGFGTIKDGSRSFKFFPDLVGYLLEKSMAKE